LHLAQLNIAESIHPMTDPRMQSFTSRIDAINALADRSPGFVWRLTDDDEDVDGALSLRLPGDENTLVNMSVWENIESLFGFVYKTVHAKVMTDNRDNFRDMVTNHFVLWWVPERHIPDLVEAKSRLDRLRKDGPSPDAFTFRLMFSETCEPLALTLPKKDCA